MVVDKVEILRRLFQQRIQRVNAMLNFDILPKINGNFHHQKIKFHTIYSISKGKNCLKNQQHLDYFL